MKKFKSLLFLVLCFVLAFGIYNTINPNGSKNAISNANAESISVTGQSVPDYPILNYLSLSMRGTRFDYKNMKATYDEVRYNNRVERSNVKYIVCVNDAFSVNFMPLEYRYRLTYTHTSDFSVKTSTITTEPNATSFEYGDKTYYFRFYDKRLNIYNVDPASSSAIPTVFSENAPNELIKFNKFTDRNEIIITNSITLNSNASAFNGKFEYPIDIEIYTTPTSTTAQKYTLNITKPAIMFANNEEAIASFESFRSGSYHEVDNWLKPEQSYNKLSLNMLSSKFNYSEDNPLYFNLNFNGFVYTFKVFSKTYGSENYLFVDYRDDANSDESKRLTRLATALIYQGVNSNGNAIYAPDPSQSIKSSDNFSMTFEKRGRYSLEFYDNTYLLGSASPNYYSTSFYISDDSGTTESVFENIYIISELNKQNGSSEYIVNTSIQNNSIKSTIKNLNQKYGDVGIKDAIKYIEISKTLYGSSDNITKYEYYIPTGSTYADEVVNLKASHPDWDITIYENFDSEEKGFLNQNGDFSFISDADGYYQIAVHKANSTNQKKEYNFTIVTQAKSTFTVDGKTLEASEPYKTQPSTHTKRIENNDKINFDLAFSSNPSTLKSTTLDKTYINTYTVLLGKQLVNVSADIGKDYITFNCQGVGDLIVEITFNGETVPYELNSEKGNSSVTYHDYGTYTVKITDSMGTTDTLTFSLTKKLNASAIILIVVAGIILVAVATFVIISRAKPKTR